MMNYMYLFINFFKYAICIGFIFNVIGVYSLNAKPQQKINKRSISNFNPIYITPIKLNEDMGQTKYIFIVRINYPTLIFEKNDITFSNSQYQSKIKAKLNFYKLNQPYTQGNKYSYSKQPSYRFFWQDSVNVATYEETISANHDYIGNVEVNLNQGQYVYGIQGEDVLATSVSKRKSPPLFIDIDTTYQMYLTSSFDNSNNMGHFGAYGYNVLYQKDFGILIFFPKHLIGKEIDIDVKYYTQWANSVSQTIYHNTFNTTSLDKKSIHLVEKTAFSTVPNDNYLMYYVEIPFENGLPFNFNIELKTRDKTLIKQNVNVLWLERPFSLINVSKAINYLSFIEKKNTIRKLKEGDKMNQTKNLYHYWKGLDPTPNTFYNERMVEYYRRVDYAINTFSTPSLSGISSDMGKVYITQGEPQSTDRMLYLDGLVQEIWTYPHAKYIFRVTSGFGDYVLVQIDNQ